MGQPVQGLPGAVVGVHPSGQLQQGRIVGSGQGFGLRQVVGEIRVVPGLQNGQQGRLVAHAGFGLGRQLQGKWFRPRPVILFRAVRDQQSQGLHAGLGLRRQALQAGDARLQVRRIRGQQLHGGQLQLVGAIGRFQLHEPGKVVDGGLGLSRAHGQHAGQTLKLRGLLPGWGNLFQNLNRGGKRGRFHLQCQRGQGQLIGKIRV